MTTADYHASNQRHRFIALPGTTRCRLCGEVEVWRGHAQTAKFMDKAATLAVIEWEYTGGQSFSVGDKDVLVWLLEEGWSITPPTGFMPTRWDDFPENREQRDPGPIELADPFSRRGGDDTTTEGKGL